VLPLKAVVYARVSTEEQTSNYSIEAQLEAARNLAAARGLEIVKEYIDEGWSGTLLNRPALNELMRDCENGKIEIIIVYRIDRFFRDVRHLLDTMDFLEAHGVKFISATEPFDTSTPVGRYILGQFGLIAELERTTFLERARAGRSRRIASGKWWGTPPFGYDYDLSPGTLVLNEREAEVIRLAYKFYKEPGETLESVANKLNALGYRGKKGYRWTGGTVHALLTRELYTGKSYLNKNEATKGNRPLIPITAPQIISRDEFEFMQELLRKRRLARDPQKRVRNFLLRYLVRCGECGSQWDQVMPINVAINTSITITPAGSRENARPNT
jgi:site-specific DNA recombinase